MDPVQAGGRLAGRPLGGRQLLGVAAGPFEPVGRPRVRRSALGRHPGLLGLGRPDQVLVVSLLLGRLGRARATAERRADVEHRRVPSQRCLGCRQATRTDRCELTHGPTHAASARRPHEQDEQQQGEPEQTDGEPEQERAGPDGALRRGRTARRRRRSRAHLAGGHGGRHGAGAGRDRHQHLAPAGDRREGEESAVRDLPRQLGGRGRRRPGGDQARAVGARQCRRPVREVDHVERDTAPGQQLLGGGPGGDAGRVRTGGHGDDVLLPAGGGGEQPGPGEHGVDQRVAASGRQRGHEGYRRAGPAGQDADHLRSATGGHHGDRGARGEPVEQGGGRGPDLCRDGARGPGGVDDDHDVGQGGADVGHGQDGQVQPVLGHGDVGHGDRCAGQRSRQ